MAIVVGEREESPNPSRLLEARKNERQDKVQAPEDVGTLAVDQSQVSWMCKTRGA